LGWWSAIIVAYHWQVLVSFLPALERVHELSRGLQTAAHHDSLLSDNGQGILQQACLVLDRRRCGRHVDWWMVYNSVSRSRVFVLPLRASPGRLHWYGGCGWYAAWLVLDSSSWLLPTAQPRKLRPAAFHPSREEGLSTATINRHLRVHYVSVDHHLTVVHSGVIQPKRCYIGRSCTKSRRILGLH